MKSILALLVVLALCAGAGWWYWQRSTAETVSFRLAEVTRGDLLASIPAAGTAEPEEVVDVGTQVAGLIDKLGPDPESATKFVDYRTLVEPGMLLAHIDDTLYAAAVDNAQAMLDQAKANLVRAQADLGQMNAKQVQAQHDWDRAQKLGPSQALAQSDFDMYQANFEIAKANVADEQAVIVQSQAGIAAAEATLKNAKRNVEYCTITSPVKGVIIDRRVNVGETVVSSLSAPSLFLIAKDLTKMQVWAPVNEADIGNVYPGQPVTFDVAAYPGRTFHGQVVKVRLNANMTSNVVTYLVEITTENDDGKLLPYMTCNVLFEVSKKSNVLMVPGTALRYIPRPQVVPEDAREVYAQLTSPRARGSAHAADAGATTRPKTGAATRPKGSGKGQKDHTDPTAGKSGIVWLADDRGFARPVKVAIGITDGINTEVTSDQLKEGDQVIVGEVAEAASGSTNPFAPQAPNRNTGTVNGGARSR